MMGLNFGGDDQSVYLASIKGKTAPKKPSTATVKAWENAYSAADAGSLGVTPKKTAPPKPPATPPSTAKPSTAKPSNAYTAADAGSLGVSPPPAHLSGAADNGLRAADAGSLGLTTALSQSKTKPKTDYTAADAGSFGVSLPPSYLSAAANDGYLAADAGSLGLITAESEARQRAEWYEDAGDGIVIESERFTAGGEVEIPTSGPELVVGAAINFQKNTAADGSVTVKADINGTLGAEVANTLGLNINGNLGTQYKFSNEAEAQRFIGSMRDAVDDKFRWSLDSRYGFELGPVQSVVDVINDYSNNHSSYRAGVELEAKIETGVGGHRVDVSAAAGVERKFDTDLSTDSTTYYARLRASTGADLGLGEKFGLRGDTQVRVSFDDQGNASTLTILGGASGSAPVRGIINSLDVVDGSSQDIENVIPGTQNKESVAANVAITLDISNPEDPVAVANLVNSLIGAQDQSFGDASGDLFDRADVRVGIMTTESSAVSADVENFEFQIGNSEVSTVAAFAKPPEGDFQQVG